MQVHQSFCEPGLMTQHAGRVLMFVGKFFSRLAGGLRLFPKGAVMVDGGLDPMVTHVFLSPL
jgi:hypothetical protein